MSDFKLKANFTNGISAPFAQVKNPKIKNNRQQIAIGRKAVFCGCKVEDIIYFNYLIYLLMKFGKVDYLYFDRRFSVSYYKTNKIK